MSRPLLPLLTAVLIGLPVLCVASFGPECWYLGKPVDGLGRAAPPDFTWASMRAPKLYWLLGELASGSGRASHALRWYATLRNPRVLLPTSLGGSHFRP